MTTTESTKTDYPLEYPKIPTLFARDPKTHKVTLLDFSYPYLEFLKDCDWLIYEKIDGTNIRVYWDGEMVHFYGRTSRAQIPCSLLEALQRIFPVEKFVNFDSPICLYGEGYGVGIQKVGANYLRSANDFALFDVRIGGYWLLPDDVSAVAQSLALDEAPLLNQCTLRDTSYLSNVLDGFESRISEDTLRAEGIVMRPAHQLFTRDGKRIIAKLKTKDFN